MISPEQITMFWTTLYGDHRPKYKVFLQTTPLELLLQKRGLQLNKGFSTAPHFLFSRNEKLQTEGEERELIFFLLFLFYLYRG